MCGHTYFQYVAPTHCNLLHGGWWSRCWVIVVDALLFLIGVVKTSFLGVPCKTTQRDLDETEELTTALSFKFPVMCPEEIRRAVEEMGGGGRGGDSCRSTPSPTTTVQNYRFLGVNNLAGFVQEPDGVSLSVEYVHTLPSQVSTKDVDAHVVFAGDKNISIKADKFDEAEFAVENFNLVSERCSPDVDSNVPICKKQHFDESKKKLMRAGFLYQKDFFPSLEETDSDDDLSIENFEEEEQISNCSSELEEEFISGRNTDNLILLKGHECESDSDTEKAKIESEEETQKVEDTNLSKSCNLEDDELDQDMAKIIEELQNHEKNKDQRNIESLWEHQNLVEQLKMELRNAKKIRLPTILEESESPKTAENPFPSNSDEKILQEDLIDELHKLYKSYREQMRNFDILNYQKMYTIGFLNLKEQLPKTNTKRNTIPSLLPQTFRLCRPRKSDQHPLNHLAMELYSDLETVYVGQTCLSWELLQWQYATACAMADLDPHRLRRHSTFVAELEQFQVLIQRFLENETFQGPRVHNYVKARCVLRSLLQVPSLGDQNIGAKNSGEASMRRLRTDEEEEASTAVLKMIENSMKVFWEFILADKEETAVGSTWVDQDNYVSNSLHQCSKLIHEVRMELNKKERKLKNLNRASHCLAKKIQKQRGVEEERANQEIFLAQVDMRLVSRVLMMSKPTTIQLIWCQKKLNRIRFSDRKVHREQYFLLFPF